MTEKSTKEKIKKFEKIHPDIVLYSLGRRIKKLMLIQILKTPVILFLYLSVVLTQSSIFFSQNIGRFQKVSGWPFVMYKEEYKRIGDIKVTGEIIHKMVKTKSTVMWEMVFINIAFWTTIFIAFWMGHKRLSRMKSK